MIKTMLIDDEEMALEELKYVLSEFPNIEIQKEYTDPLKALKDVNKYKPDLIMLDIEMPEINGFAVAEQILTLQPNICIVFITAYDEYAIKAFEANAIDYVLKPVAEKRLRKTINKVNEICVKNKDRMVTDNILKLNKQFRGSIDKIVVWENDEIILLKPSDVLYFEAQVGNNIVVTEKRQYRTKNTLGYWEDRLSGKGFFRCHRGYIVNLNRIERIMPMFNNTFILSVHNHLHQIPVSRSASKELKKILDI